MIIRKVMNRTELIEKLKQLNLNIDYIMNFISKNGGYNGTDVSIFRNIDSYGKLQKNRFIITFEDKSIIE